MSIMSYLVYRHTSKHSPLYLNTNKTHLNTRVKPSKN